MKKITISAYQSDKKWIPSGILRVFGHTTYEKKLVPPFDNEFDTKSEAVDFFERHLRKEKCYANYIFEKK